MLRGPHRSLSRPTWLRNALISYIYCSPLTKLQIYGMCWMNKFMAMWQSRMTSQNPLRHGVPGKGTTNTKHIQDLAYISVRLPNKHKITSGKWTLLVVESCDLWGAECVVCLVSISRRRSLTATRRIFGVVFCVYSLVKRVYHTDRFPHKMTG